MTRALSRARARAVALTGSRRRARRLQRLADFRRSPRAVGTNDLFATADRLSSVTVAPGDDRVLRQVLIDALLQRGLMPTLRRAKLGESVAVPAPRAWRRALARDGVRVLRVSSALGWSGYVLRRAGAGGAAYVRLLRRRPNDSPPLDDRPTVVLGLFADALPRPDAPTRDFVTWIRAHLAPSGALWAQSTLVAPGPRPGCDVVRHPYPALAARERWRFALRGAAYVARTILRGRSADIVLLASALEADYVGSLPLDRLPRMVIAHNGLVAMRPMWTNIIERAGGEVLLVFYSTNIEGFEVDGRPVTFTYPGYRLMTWPRYLVWDEYQAAYLGRLLDDVQIEVIGPVDFSDSGSPLPHVERSVAVFDVTPQATAAAVARGLAIAPYYTADRAARFLDDVVDAVEDVGGEVAIKQKRDIGSLAPLRYAEALDALATRPAVHLLDPATSAVRLVEASVATISMPFTGTALLGRARGVPSAFFDPSGRIIPRTPVAHGIEVLTSRRQLRTWLRRALGDSPAPQSPVERLVLGTAQLGFDYGVTNRRGRPAGDVAEEILRLATSRGIRLVDSAGAYGDAEEVVGRHLTGDVGIVTKIAPLGAIAGHAVGAAIAEQVEVSLSRLRRRSLHALLVHDSVDILGPNGAAVIDALIAAREAGQCGGIGVSVYDPEELDAVLDRFKPDLVQLPLNLWDQRFLAGGQLRELHDHCIEVHARSVLLQGVLVADPYELPAPVAGCAGPLRRTRTMAEALGLTMLDAALGFALAQPEIAGVVVGVAGVDELEEILAAANTEPIDVDWSRFAIDDPVLVDPRRW